MLFINPLNFFIMEFKQVQVLKSVYVGSPNHWEFIESNSMYFTPDQYFTFVSEETIKWFMRIGSKQVVKRSNTSFGRQITELCSFAPDNTEKHVYNFRFIQ
jgi:hypothetical protein